MLVAHEDLSKSKIPIMKSGGDGGPFCGHRLLLNGFNNLRMSWRSSKYSTRRSSWLSISLAFLLCLCIILDSSTRVAGYPASLSRSNRDAKYNPSATTTLQNLQGADSGSGSSLSIMSPIMILRENMVAEIKRRKMRHAMTRQYLSNKEILDRIG